MIDDIGGSVMRDDIPAGTKLKCRRSLDYYFTDGREYCCISGLIEGLFPDRPYVEVVDDRGKRVTAHASRFEVV